MSILGFPHTRLFVLLTFFAMAAIVQAVPVAPSNCVAAGIAKSSGFGAKFVLSWKDNSTDEVRWRIHYKVNGEQDKIWDFLTSSTTVSTGGIVSVLLDTSYKGILGPLGTSYTFKVYAISNVLSAASNETSVTPDLFNATASQVSSQVAVNLSWAEIQNASSYKIYSAPSGSPYSHITTAPSGATSALVAAPAAGTTCYFKVEAYLGSVLVGSVEVSTPVNVITSKTGSSGTAGASLSHTFTQATVGSVSSRALRYNGQSTLPAGLSFNSSSGVLSGVYPAVGNYTLVYTATLSNGAQVSQTFYVRVRPEAGAPEVASAIPSWTGAAGTSRLTDLSAAFRDPEAESAVRVETTLGSMDFILFDSATPATVANFMNYVAAGKYADVAFHRHSDTSSKFFIEGGGYKGTGTGSHFTSVLTNPPVVNEPGIANVRGTVSMAKLDGDANSATSQFFVNLADNRSDRDYKNGGYTVFGRVAGDGMTVADAIAALPTKTYDLLLDGGSTAVPFNDFPMNAPSAPAAMDQTKLVKINSVTPIPTMTYSVTGNTNPYIATASVVDGQLQLVGRAPGHTTITVTATDLDNLSVSQTMEVNLDDTFSAWAARTWFPEDQSGLQQNPDGDSLNNLLEYAFMGDPATASEIELPWYGQTGVAPEGEFMTVSFSVRKSTNGLSYVVEGTDSLDGAWSAVWNSTDGFVHPQVLEAYDLTSYTYVKIKDTVAIGGEPMRFLRVRVVQE